MKSCCQHPMTRIVTDTEGKETLDFLASRVERDKFLRQNSCCFSTTREIHYACSCFPLTCISLVVWIGIYPYMDKSMFYAFLLVYCL